MARVEKVAEMIRQEVSNIIHDELHDPRAGFITITRVEVTPDLSFARIWFSVLGKEEERKKSKKALECALGFIRRNLAERINLRLAPEIIFEEDYSSEYSVRIEEVLQEIKKLDESCPSSGVRVKDKRGKEGRDEPHKNIRRTKKKT